jgi:polysaccharide export outer membrane protein
MPQAVDKAILLILSLALGVTALCASPLPEEQNAIVPGAVLRSSDGNARPASDEEAKHPSLERRNPRYQLGNGDILELAFAFTPEFNQTVTIQPDGYIGLRGVGDIHVAGQTVPELTQSLRTAYGKILHDPVISITLGDNAKHSQVLLFRKGSSDWVEVKKINIKRMLQQSESLSEDLHLRPGDMLFVPKNAVSKIKPWIPYPSLGFYLSQL